MPETLQNNLKVLEQNYSTIHSEYNFKEYNTSFRATKFTILAHGTRLWNKYTDKL